MKKITHSNYHGRSLIILADDNQDRFVAYYRSSGRAVKVGKLHKNKVYPICGVKLLTESSIASSYGDTMTKGWIMKSPFDWDTELGAYFNSENLRTEALAIEKLFNELDDAVENGLETLETELVDDFEQVDNEKWYELFDELYETTPIENNSPKRMIEFLERVKNEN